MEAARTRTPLAVDGAAAPSRHLLRLASDAKLVGRIRGGSERAFEALFERHHRGILSFCRHMLGSREEAEDAVQQVFANAYRDMLRSDRELNVKPWLYRIARNQCISMLRARRHDAELLDDEPSLVGLSDQVAQRDQLRDLLHDLGRLPVDQREALVLAELHDNSHVEVAAILGCEREKVKSLVFQARSSLIKSREARDVSCEEVRRQLSVLRGGSLRRNAIRRHLQNCEGCRAFRNEVKQQRQAMAVILPVVPSVALKVGAANAIAAAGVATVATGGGSAAATAGPLAAVAGKLGISTAAVKGAAATVAVTVAAGGGAVAVQEVREPARDHSPAGVERPAGDQSAPGGPRGPVGAAAVAPGALVDRDKVGRSKESRARGKRRLKHRAGRPGAAGPRQADELGQPLSPAAGKREAAARKRAERKTLRERAERRKRRGARKPARRKPARRKPAVQEPVRKAPAGTSPADPAPTDPLSREGGTTFP